MSHISFPDWADIPSLPIPHVVYSYCVSSNSFYQFYDSKADRENKSLCKFALYRFECLTDILECLIRLPFSATQTILKVSLLGATLFSSMKAKREVNDAIRELQVIFLFMIKNAWALIDNTPDDPNCPEDPFSAIKEPGIISQCLLPKKPIRTALHFYQSTLQQNNIFYTLLFMKKHQNKGASSLLRMLALPIIFRAFFLKDILEGLIHVSFSITLLVMRLLIAALTLGINNKARELLKHSWFQFTSTLLCTGLALIGVLFAERVEQLHIKFMTLYNRKELRSHSITEINLFENAHDLLEKKGLTQEQKQTLQNIFVLEKKFYSNALQNTMVPNNEVTVNLAEHFAELLEIQGSLQKQDRV